MPKIKIETDPKTRNFLLRKRLEEMMRDKWNCYNRNPKKSIPCRELLLHLIKTKIAFPQYKKKNPNITTQQMEELWNETGNSPKSVSPSRSSSRSSPFTCPNCKSDDIVFTGFEGSTAICENCGVSWQVLGGTNNIFVSQSAVPQMPTIQAYIDKKGNEIDPNFPKIFTESTAKEKYLQKSIKEFYEILKRENPARELPPTWDLFVRQTVFIWVKYLESLPQNKGMPKKDKRKALLAVLTYYANILANREMDWKKISVMFGVLVEDMDKIEKNEIAVFWKTPQGRQVGNELFPLLKIREKPRKSHDGPKSELLTKIQNEEPSATQLGLDAFVANLDGETIKPPAGITKAQLNKQRKVIERYFENKPTELSKLMM